MKRFSCVYNLENYWNVNMVLGVEHIWSDIITDEVLTFSYAQKLHLNIFSNPTHASSLKSVEHAKARSETV